MKVLLVLVVLIIVCSSCLIAYNDNRVVARCVWCSKEIHGEGSQHFEWWLHDNCYKEVDRWAGYILWYLNRTPISEYSMKRSEMITRLIKLKIKLEREG